MSRPFFFIVAFALSACATVKHPYLFEAERDGKKAVILGTVHRGVALNELPGYVVDELKSSSAVFLELDRRHLPDPESDTYETDMKNFAIHYYGVKPGEPLLDKRLGEADFKLFQKRVSAIKPDTLKYLSPAGAFSALEDNSTVEVSRYQSKLMRPQSAMDFRLEMEAKEANLKTFELDEVSETYSGGLQIPCSQEENEFLTSEIKRILHGGAMRESQFLELLDAYRDSNDSQLMAIVESDGRSGKCLFGERNVKWANRLDNYVAHVVFPGKKIFVAAGVGHLLPGRYPSLLELLKARGFKITRVEK